MENHHIMLIVLGCNGFVLGFMFGLFNFEDDGYSIGTRIFFGFGFGLLCTFPLFSFVLIFLTPIIIAIFIGEFIEHFTLEERVVGYFTKKFPKIFRRLKEK